MKKILGTLRCAGYFNGLWDERCDFGTAQRFLSMAVEMGFEFIDTAPLYARGAAELTIGSLKLSRAKLWTKVGVDIDSPLPRLDYSVNGMLRSLYGSLNRLQAENVDTIFVHNPSPRILMRDEVYEFAYHVNKSGASEHVGLSLARPRDVIYVKDFSQISYIACAHLEYPGDRKYLLRDCVKDRLVLRSIFLGGVAFKDGTPAVRVIDSALTAVNESLLPSAVIVAPRTKKQLLAYRHLF